MRRDHHGTSFSLCFAVALGLLAAQERGVVTTNQTITPAGMEAVFTGRVYGVAFGADESEVWVLTANDVHQLAWRANRTMARIPFDGAAGLQGIRYDVALRGVVVSGAHKEARRGTQARGVRLFTVSGGSSARVGGDLNGALGGALAVASGARLAVVPLVSANEVAVVDLGGKAPTRHIAAGKAPFGAVVDAAGKVAWVSNWGGRAPVAGDLTATTGMKAESDRVVVDARGIASSGTVVRLDLERGAVTAAVDVGLHPSALAWDETHRLLYVANGNDDSVSVVDTARPRVVRTIAIEPFGQKLHGVAPTALALSRDGATLYVACGGLNAVAVIDTGAARIAGLIPTAWYPNGLALSGNGKYLAVSSLLGIGAGWRTEPKRKAVQAIRGTVHVVEVPGKAQLASYTSSVAENNRLDIRARAENPSPIEHVVYIIKEDRTYDQVLGDMGRGNSDPSLVMYGRKITPNHHRLAEEFVLLDNFYATGGNSGDGHQWLTQANETDYCMWPGYIGRSYPFDGSDPLAYSRNGFIWEAALRMGKTVRVFGEFVPSLSVEGVTRAALLEEWKQGRDFSGRWKVEAAVKPLNPLLVPDYPSYTLTVPDVARARIFLRELAGWERSGKMPHLTIVQLPSNHTLGTRPGASTPAAMVADNDLALGQIVEALTRTPFWKKMAIFVVEDDAQDGVDHVDGHRTVALVASPYARRGAIDSTMYSHPSMLKTIELILGLPTLSLFDLIANPMTASFTDQPDYRGYTAVVPEQSLFDVNPPAAALRGPALRGARDSMAMRFDNPDDVPSEKLNRILWHAARGWQTPYPKLSNAAFAPPRSQP